MDTQDYILNSNNYQKNDYNNADYIGINTDVDNSQNIYPLPELNQNSNSSNFPQPQIDYSNYHNLNELNHRGIQQINENTFYIRKQYNCLDLVCFFSILTILIIIFSLIFIFDGISLIGFISLIITVVVTFLLSLCADHNCIKFELNQYNIKVTKTNCCSNKEEIIYTSGQIIEIKFKKKTFINRVKNKYHYSYEIKIIQNIPGKEPELTVYNVSDKRNLFTNEEIKYFNYITNHHIQNNII